MLPEFLLALVLLLLAAMLLLYRKVQAQNRVLVSRNQSLSTRYGKMTEQFMPFLKDYPYDGRNFRFLGSPVDGIQFEDDRIVLVEFKTGDSRLSEKQNRIKELVKKGRVFFEEIRIKTG